MCWAASPSAMPRRLCRLRSRQCGLRTAQRRALFLAGHGRLRSYRARRRWKEDKPYYCALAAVFPLSRNQMEDSSEDPTGAPLSKTNWDVQMMSDTIGLQPMEFQLSPNKRLAAPDTIGLQPMEFQHQPNLSGKGAHSCHR